MDEAAIPSKYTCRYPAENKVTLYFWQLQTPVQISAEYKQDEASTGCKEELQLEWITYFPIQTTLFYFTAALIVTSERFALANVQSNTSNVVNFNLENSFFSFGSIFHSHLIGSFNDG